LVCEEFGDAGLGGRRESGYERDVVGSDHLYVPLRDVEDLLDLERARPAAAPIGIGTMPMV
jgi:hypothetical protein